MKKVKLTTWDAADHLQTDAEVVAYLDAAFEDGDPSLVTAALGDVARARGMTELAKATGLGRESLYKALSPTGNPEIATVLKILHALGLRLRARPAHRDRVPARRRTKSGPRRDAATF